MAGTPPRPSRPPGPPQQMPVSNAVKMSKWLGEKFRLMSRVNSARNRKVFRGQVYWCEFGENIGSEQNLRRPAVILQNDSANLSSPNTIVAPITNSASTHGSVHPLGRPASSPLSGYVLLGNIVTISKARLGDHIDNLDRNTELPLVEEAMYNSLGVAPYIANLRDKLEKTSDYLEKVKGQRNEAQDALVDIRAKLGISKTADLTTILSEIDKLQKDDSK